MTFEKYNEVVKQFAQYPQLGANMVYPAMGIVGEAGELCDKIKKHWRNKTIPGNINDITAMGATSLTIEEKANIVLEMGDVLWYLNALANELNVSLDEVAYKNMIKLADRAKRNMIKSEGDSR